MLFRWVRGPIRLRNVKAGEFATADRLFVGEVVRCDSRTFIHTLDGRRANTFCSTLFISDAQYVGLNYGASGASPGCMSKLPVLSHVRIVYVDACKLRWCSIGGVFFHSFA